MDAPKKTRREIDILTQDDVRGLMAACSRRSPTGVRNRALIALLYGSGLRIAEALALKPKDLDLQRLAVTVHAGKRGNQPTPPAFRESVKVGEQNLYTRAKELVGDRNPREHEFSIQMRSIDADKSGAGLGLPALVALCGALLGRNTRGGTVIVGALNLGGSIEMIPNAVRIAELAVDKQAQTLLMPVAARRQLNDLPDELWTKINIEFYKDAADAVFKGLVE
jgi:predicted ATP-dependent Lon-type protease